MAGIEYQSSALGLLQEDADIDEWLVSSPVSVPFFDGRDFPFYWAGDIEDEDFLLEAEKSSRRFLKCSSRQRDDSLEVLAQFAYRLQVLISNEFAEAQAIGWSDVVPYEVFVVQAATSVELKVKAHIIWDDEHAIELHFGSGLALTSISTVDGYLTVTAKH